MKQLKINVVLASLLMSFAMSAQDAAVRVQTHEGTLEGIKSSDDHIERYLGVPYAQPPVGDLRWVAPQPLDKRSEVLEVKNFGNSPLQANVFGDMSFRGPKQSEDCLYLNVWTPNHETKEKLPVLIYFHGGGFVAGDGSEPRYDGAAMASKGIVVVTVNYRLNIFGFLAHSELSAKAPYKASGNYGLLDQNFAMQWVANNIEAFGGDPKRITIAGESAGSISVSLHMASPMSKNLIAGAIGESGAAVKPTLAAVNLEEAEKIGADFVGTTGKTLEELRKMPADELFKIYVGTQRFGFPSVIDGHFLTASVEETFTSGKQAKVPLLAGWNSAEIPGIAFLYNPKNDPNLYLERVKQEYPNDFERVLKLYPGTTEKEVLHSSTALASDRFIVYATWRWIELQRLHSDQPVYRYLYSKMRPLLVDKNKVSGLAGGTQDGTSMPKPEIIGAPHACEIEYAMGNLNLVKDYEWTNDDFTTSITMQAYFANFIKHGNPNGPGLPEWSSIQVPDDKPAVMIIDTESKEIKSQIEARYQFHQEFYHR